MGGFIGNNQGTITNCYATGSTSNGPNYAALGGFVGLNTGTISTCYAIGPITNAFSPGGFVGDNGSGGAINDCYYSTDGTGQSNGTGDSAGGTVSYNGVPTIDVTGLTLAQMMNPANFDSAWNFTVGTGAWGIYGYSKSGSINNGLPFLQSQYTGVASFTPLSQTTAYNGTNTVRVFQPRPLRKLSGRASKAPVVTGPVITVSGANVNAGTSNSLYLSGLSVSNANYAVELPPSSASVSITPKPITVSALTDFPPLMGIPQPSEMTAVERKLFLVTF